MKKIDCWNIGNVEKKKNISKTSNGMLEIKNTITEKENTKWDKQYIWNSRIKYQWTWKIYKMVWEKIIKIIGKVSVSCWSTSGSLTRLSRATEVGGRGQKKYWRNSGQNVPNLEKKKLYMDTVKQFKKPQQIYNKESLIKAYYNQIAEKQK